MLEKYHGNKGLEYYKAYPRDFFEGSIGMPGPLRGFYRMVIDLIYMHDGFLLSDWGHISGLTGYGKTQCKRMMNDLVQRGKIQLCGENGEYFTQKRAKNELKASRKFQENQSNKAFSRWEINDLEEIPALPLDMPPQDHKTTRPQDKKKEPIGSKKKPKSRETSITENWTTSAKNIADAEKQGLTNEEISYDADKFRDHHLAKGSTFKSWDAAWRNWVRNSIKFKAGRSGHMAGGSGPGGYGQGSGNQPDAALEQIARLARTR